MADGRVVEQESARRDRFLAVLCELWCWLGPLAVLSLVLRFTVARHVPLLRGVTTEVLNLQIAAIVPGVVMVIAGSARWDLLTLAAWAVFFIIVVYGYVVGVIGAIKAWNGEAWRYPVNLRVVA